MNSYLTPQPLYQIKGALSVVYLRKCRALFVREMARALWLNIRGLDGPDSLVEKGLSCNLLRPELISAYLGTPE